MDFRSRHSREDVDSEQVSGRSVPRNRRRSGRGSGPRGKGSAVVLVVVAMSLMAVMGAVYLQSVQKEVKSTRDLRNDPHTDLITEAVIKQISQVLKDDLMDENGDFFTENDADEAYDYPWTNFTAQSPQGGQFDDRWLASSSPRFPDPSKGETFDPYWPHLTNLNSNSIYLQTSGGIPSSTEQQIHDGARLDTDQSIDGLIDADGDGIGDSRWTWAPIKEIDGTRYVMAVRIIDNSAMVNVNVATSQVGADGKYTPSGTTGSRWWNPAELNLGRFVHELDGTAAMAELGNVLTYRFNNGTIALPVDWEKVRDYWKAGPSTYQPNPNGPRWLTIDNELELRHRNGLNNLDNTCQLESEDVNSDLSGNQSGFRTFLRQTATDKETAWNKNTGFTNMESYFNDEPRHQMTTVSGAVEHILTASGTGGKMSLNRVMVPSGKLIFDEIQAKQVRRLLAPVPSPEPPETEPPETPEGSTLFEVGDVPMPPYFVTAGYTINEYAEQIAVSMLDYADEDNTISVHKNWDNDAVTHNGFEALPFITEAYAQALYKVESSTEVAENTWETKWNLVGADEADKSAKVGYAIEIRNPFTNAISLKNVHLIVNDVDWGDLSKFVFMRDASPVGLKLSLNVGEVLVIYRPSGYSPADVASGANNLELLYQEPDPDNPGPTPKIIRPFLAQISQPWPINQATVKVELKCKTSNISNDDDVPTAGYAYVRFEPEGMMDQYTETTASEIPADYVDFRRVAAIGNSHGLNMMAVRPTDPKPRIYHLENPQPSAAVRDTATDDIVGLASKGVNGANDVLFSPSKQQIVVCNRGYFAQVGEIADVVLWGVDLSQTIAEGWNWHSGPQPKDYLLPITNTEEYFPGDSIFDELQVPHSVMIMNLFTTLTGQFVLTGVDEDKNGLDDIRTVQFIPGTINLNTATKSLLKRILPIPDSDGTSGTNGVLDKAIDAVINFRDNPSPGFRPGNFRSKPGIAGIGELMSCQALRNVLGTGNNVDDKIFDFVTDDDVLVDFASSGGTEVPFADGAEDDREEETMLARWLMQTCSTRSDIFTAYVLIQGYKPQSDGSYNYDNPDEAARLFVVFDRSEVEDADDSARVLGVYRYP